MKNSIYLALAILALGHSTASSQQLKRQELLGREAIIYTPAKAAPFGSRPLVIVLHGGLGNAGRIASGNSESALNMNANADKGGFVVAYLNGTPIVHILGPDKLGWNAGNCCGQPAENKVDDVAYIESAAKLLTKQYGIDPARVYGVGHSNGAMMIQRVMCETSVLALAAPISGALETGVDSCPPARGKRLLAIHGENDLNVPIAGGKGEGIARVTFHSQSDSKRTWTNSSTGYELAVIKGAGHSIASINEQITKNEGRTLGTKLATFFGLAQ